MRQHGSKIFLAKGLDRKITDLPVGQTAGTLRPEGFIQQQHRHVDLICADEAEIVHDIDSESGLRSGAMSYSGMPAIRQACDNLSISSALRNLVLILDIRRAGFSCTRRAKIPRASSTRPDIARHAARIKCAFR